MESIPIKESKMSITMKELAKRIGYGVGTVSRALNSSSRSVKDETREKIIKAAKKYGYIMDSQAQALRMGKTRDIALVLPAVFRSAFFNDFYIKIISSTLKEAEDRGYQLRLFWLDENNSIRDLVEKTRSFNLSGLILSAMCFEGYRLPDNELKEIGIPVVVLMKELKGKNVWSVCLDDFQGGYDAATYLINSGHRDIGILKGPHDDHKLRYEGYEKAMSDNKIKVEKEYVLESEGGEYSSHLEMIEFLKKRRQYPTAFFCVGDEIAIGAMRALYEKKINCPGKISIMGYDNMQISELLIPRLTTMSRPVDEMGKLAVRTLIDPKKNTRGKVQKVTAKIIERDTCRRIK